MLPSSTIRAVLAWCQEPQGRSDQPLLPPGSCGMKLNLDYLLEMLWEYLALTCIYTKKRGRESGAATLPLLLTLA